MAISEQQLNTWSQQGSVTGSKTTYEIIGNALKAPGTGYSTHSYNIYLQGSYGNSTNIIGSSDVDIVMCLDSIFYSDIGNLTQFEKDEYNRLRTSGGYSFDEFKKDVVTQLVTKFGGSVEVGSKAIKIHGNENRRDCDVLCCVENRDYYKFAESDQNSFRDGICFWDKSGSKIVNYPKQHLANCVAKNRSTSSRYKPTVRIIKNMRNRMIDEGVLDDGLAPSYYLEGMLYNVPDAKLDNELVPRLANCLNWLDQCDRDALLCANEMYYLLRTGSKVCWNPSNFNSYIQKTIEYWNNQ